MDSRIDVTSFLRVGGNRQISGWAALLGQNLQLCVKQAVLRVREGGPRVNQANLGVRGGGPRVNQADLGVRRGGPHVNRANLGVRGGGPGACRADLSIACSRSGLGGAQGPPYFPDKEAKAWRWEVTHGLHSRSQDSAQSRAPVTQRPLLRADGCDFRGWRVGLPFPPIYWP